MLVYGTTIKYKKLGYAADFCALCALPRQFVIERLGKAYHLYWISFGEGKLVEHRRVCMHCHTQFEADPMEYRTLAAQPAPIAELTRETFHNLAHARGYQIERARQVRDDPASLTPEQRHQMLLEPFLILSARLGQRTLFTGGEFESSYVRREIFPLLAAALARLRPSQAEIEAVMQRLHKVKDALARQIKVPLLMAAINDHLSRPAPVRAPLSRRKGGGVQAGYMDAVRAMRLLSIICAFAVAAMAIALVRGVVLDEPLEPVLLMVLAAAGALGALMHFVVAPAIARHDQRGRIGGFAIAALCCAMIPIGPVVGLYLAWCLTVGWGDYFDRSLLQA